MDLHVTHIGTATALLELGGLRILTDPVLGGSLSCHFGWGMRSTHLRHDEIDLEALGRIDLVLLSHDQHEDNLDPRGRAWLREVGRVVTTRRAAQRLRDVEQTRIDGLRPFEHVEVESNVGTVRITATPARHGPPLSLPIVGPVVGFVLEWPGADGGVWISGDTVYFGGLEEVAQRFSIETALLHLGAAAYGPLRFTMDAKGGARAAKLVDAKRVIPLHYSGWTHFSERPEAIAPAFEAAGLADRLLLLQPGVRTLIG